MPTLRIFRGDFQSLRQDELATYAENIITRCAGNPAYSQIETLIGELQVAVKTYNEALVAARNRGLDTLALRRQSRAVLLGILNRIAHILEFHAPDEVYVINAGMKPVSKRQMRTTELPSPQAVQVLPTGNRGEVSLLVSVPTPAQVQTNAVEYSPDHGASWQNGTYTKRNRVLLTGLPSGQELLFRVRSIGTRGRVSAWSEAVSQFVL